MFLFVVVSGVLLFFFVVVVDLFVRLRQSRVTQAALELTVQLGMTFDILILWTVYLPSLEIVGMHHYN